MQMFKKKHVTIIPIRETDEIFAKVYKEYLMHIHPYVLHIHSLMADTHASLPSEVAFG